MAVSRRYLALAPAPVLVAFLVTAQLVRPLPQVGPAITLTASEQIGTPLRISWPAAGAAAFVIERVGSFGSAGPNAPRPMASTAKVMTALLTLEDHPLALGQAGPPVSVSPADVAGYQRDLRAGESVLPVAAGEQLSEYQLLQGLLLPSASNFADMLATWDAGSLEAFVARMNKRAIALGMTQTHYADPAGFSAQSVSVPADLIRLARTAMALPVFAQIVAQVQASLPVAGTVRSLDTLLGRDGVIGVKTGHTDQAGGCFVFAADVAVDGRQVRIYGAVMGQPGALAGAFSATTVLLHSVVAGLHTRVLAEPGQIAGRYTAPWQAVAHAEPAKAITLVLSDGVVIHRLVQLHVVSAPLPSGSAVGTLVVMAGDQSATVPLRTREPLSEPDLLWRLTRSPFQ